MLIVKKSCLDEVAEIAVLPSFDGCLGEVNIPGNNACFLFHGWPLADSHELMMMIYSPNILSSGTK